MKSSSGKILTFIEKYLPRYSWIPVAFVALFNLAGYCSINTFMDKSRCHQLMLPLDEQIPFRPFFIVFYFLVFLQWAVNWIMIGRQEKAFCNRYAHADTIAKIICFVCFIVYPTIIVRPSVEVTDFFTWLVSVTYWFDRNPVNIMPSIHVLGSWIAVRAAFEMKNVSWLYKAANIFMLIMCCLSVVYVKQHYVIDIPTGILVTEIGLLAARKTDNERFLWIS